MSELVVKILGTFKEVTDGFWGGNIVYLVIALASVVLLIVKRDKFSRGSKLFIAFSMLTVVLLIYNPALHLLFVKMPESNMQVFNRLWLLVPVWMIIAYALSAGLSEMKNKVLCYALCFVAALLLIVAGKTLVDQNMVNTPRDIYKINPLSIQIADDLLAMNEGEPVSVAFFVRDYEGGGNFVNGGNVAAGITQYTGMVNVDPHYYTEEVWNEMYLADVLPYGDIRSIDHIDHCFQDHLSQGNDYVIIEYNEIVDGKVQTLGYDTVGRYENYIIYNLRADDV